MKLEYQLILLLQTLSETSIQLNGKKSEHKQRCNYFEVRLFNFTILDGLILVWEHNYNKPAFLCKLFSTCQVNLKESLLQK